MPRFKNINFYQNSPKIKLFLKKNAKFSSAGNCEFLSTPLPHFAPFVCFLSFCFEQFFLDRSVANLMMLTIDVCLVLNCFLFEKFYLHYALCDFDSILLHCTKLFIRQSIDREQIFKVTFQPPIEKSSVRHWSVRHQLWIKNAKKKISIQRNFKSDFNTNFFSIILTL